MDFFQLFFDTMAYIQDYFVNSAFPWMLTWGATSTTFWLIGFLFTYAIYFLWVSKISEEDRKKVMDLKARLETHNKVMSEQFSQASIVERALMYVILFVLLMILWPIFLGAYVFVITKEKI